MLIQDHLKCNCCWQYLLRVSCKLTLFFVLKSALESSEPLGSALLLEVSMEDFLRLESEYDMRSLIFIVSVDIVKRSCVYKDSYANC